MTIDKVIGELLKATAENTDLPTAKATPRRCLFTSHELLNDGKLQPKAPVYPIKKYMDVAEVKNANGKVF